MKLDIVTCAKQLPLEVKNYFRRLLLTSLNDDQLVVLRGIELSGYDNARCGHRGMYRDPVDMHQARLRQKWKCD